MTACERVGRVDGRVARLAKERVVSRAVPPGPATRAAVAGSRRLPGHGGDAPLLLEVAHVSNYNNKRRNTTPSSSEISSDKYPKLKKLRFPSTVRTQAKLEDCKGRRPRRGRRTRTFGAGGVHFCWRRRDPQPDLIPFSIGREEGGHPLLLSHWPDPRFPAGPTKAPRARRSHLQ